MRLAFADAHFKCISVQVSTAGGIALNAPRHEKSFGGERGGADRGKASEHSLQIVDRERHTLYFEMCPPTAYNGQ